MSLISIISEWKFIGQFYLPSGRGAESGFTLLNWIFGALLGLPYRVFIIFLALIGAIALYKYLERNSRAPLLGAMTMYIYLLRESAYFTALRRSTALTFILFALIAMEDRKLMKAALILLFGATMHMSALLFLPLLAIMHIKITRKLFLKTILLTVAGIVVIVPISANLMPQFLMLVGKAAYLRGMLEEQGMDINVDLKAVWGCTALSAVYFCLNFKLLSTRYNDMLCKILFFTIALSAVPFFAIILPNIYYYLIPSCLIPIENLIIERREDWLIKRVLWLIAFVVLIATLYHNIENTRNTIHGISYEEYKTVWNSASGN